MIIRALRNFRKFFRIEFRKQLIQSAGIFMLCREQSRHRRVLIRKRTAAIQKRIAEVQIFGKSRLHAVRCRGKTDHRAVYLRAGDGIEPKANTAANQGQEKYQQAGLPVCDANQNRHQYGKHGGKYGPSEIIPQFFLRFSFLFHPSSFHINADM